MDMKITVSGPQSTLAEKLADWLQAQGFNVQLQDEGLMWTYRSLGDEHPTITIVTEQVR